MIYVKVPKKPRVEGTADLLLFNNVRLLFERHGFAISRFGKNMITFYNKMECRSGEDINSVAVPVDSYFKMSTKEFRVFAQVVKQLDDLTNR